MATVMGNQADYLAECIYEVRYLEAYLVLAWLGRVEDVEENVSQAITYAASVAETLGMSCYSREDWKAVAERDFGVNFPPKPPRRPDSPEMIPVLPPGGPRGPIGAAEPVPTSHDY